jgi:hypothetical protein
MATTPMDSFAVDLATLGPVYPFVGTEIWLVLAALVIWIAFHVWQIRFEDRRFNAELNRLRTPEQVAKVLKDHAHRDGR